MLRKILIGLGVVLAVLLIVEIVGLLSMKTSVTRYAQYWKARASQPAADGAFIYVALGDSTAQGIGATSAARGYVGLLAGQIATKTGRPVRVINLSVTGAKVRDVLDKRLPELAGYNVKPDFVTMEIGANDLLSYDAASFQTDYDTILSQLPAGKTVISDMPYFGGRVNAHGNDVAASKVIVSLAQKHNIPVAPLYDSLRKRHSLRIYAADYFHPSNYGYTIWRDAFWPVIEPKL